MKSTSLPVLIRSRNCLPFSSTCVHFRWWVRCCSSFFVFCVLFC